MSVVGVFRGPWASGHIAKDGALIGFADIERCAERTLGPPDNEGTELTWLDVSMFLSDDLAERLSRLDVIYGNCGPLTALLLFLRERHKLGFRVVREARTLGWIGYGFQEFVARSLARPDDTCAHVCPYSGRVWQGVRQAGADVHHYPLLDKITVGPVDPSKSVLRCGYFSRLARHKGFHFVPAIIGKLRAANWPIESLTTCGAIDDQTLFNDSCDALRQEGLAVDHSGQASHQEALSLMDQVDVVLFPSVSNIEAVGRTVVEAVARGKLVIASDYAGASDILPAPFRIPLSLPQPTRGPSAEGFCIADLAVADWRPPPVTSSLLGSAASCSGYLYDRKDFLQALGPDGATDRLIGPRQQPGQDVGMAFDWSAFEHRSAERWCEAVWALLREETQSRADLLDLGGAMKRSVRRAGFEPDVQFWLKAEECSARSQANRKEPVPAVPL